MKARKHPWKRIEAAADEAAEQVLKEDRLLRKYGTSPHDGRSR